MKSAMNQLTRIFPWTPVIVFIIFMIAIIYTAFSHGLNEIKSVRMQQERNLAAVADLKVGQIVQWLNEREGDAFMIQESSAIARAVKNYFVGKALEQELTRWIEAVCTHNGYASATIYDDKGTVRFTYGPGGESIGKSAYKRIHNVMRRQRYGMSDLHISEVTNKPAIGFIIPLILWEAKDHPSIGAVFSGSIPTGSSFP